MTTHNPIETTPTLFICPICAWRGVLTTAGLVTTEHGDDNVDHRATIAAQQQQARVYAEQILNRLREQFASGAALPSAAHDADDTEDRAALTLNQLQRLYRAVVGEFRG